MGDVLADKSINALPCVGSLAGGRGRGPDGRIRTGIRDPFREAGVKGQGGRVVRASPVPGHFGLVNFARGTCRFGNTCVLKAWKILIQRNCYYAKLTRKII